MRAGESAKSSPGDRQLKCCIWRSPLATDALLSAFSFGIYRNCVTPSRNQIGLHSRLHLGVAVRRVVDSQEALALVDAIPPLHGQRGRPRQRPDCVLGDRGWDATAIRRGLRTRHIVPWLAMRRTTHGSGLGRWRWVAERTFAWLNQFRRLRMRYDKRADIHEAFLSLGCALILLAIAAEDVDGGLSECPFSSL
jgi:transposase